MSRAVEYLDQELANVRTGRASPGTHHVMPFCSKWHACTSPMLLTAGLLDNLKVQVYGQKMPLRAAANVSVRDAQTLLVTAFDPSVRHVMVSGSVFATVHLLAAQSSIL